MSGGLCILVVSQSRKRLDQLLDALAASPDEHHLVGRLDKALNLPRWVEEVTPDVIVMDLATDSAALPLRMGMLRETMGEISDFFSYYWQS